MKSFYTWQEFISWWCYTSPLGSFSTIWRYNSDLYEQLVVRETFDAYLNQLESKLI
jgi:hypothetical protein